MKEATAKALTDAVEENTDYLAWLCELLTEFMAEESMALPEDAFPDYPSYPDDEDECDDPNCPVCGPKHECHYPNCFCNWECGDNGC